MGRLPIEFADAEEPRPTENRAQRRPKLVGNDSEKLVFSRISCLRLSARCLFSLEQDDAFAFGAVALGYISKNQHSAVQHVATSDRRGTVIDGNLRAIFLNQ